MRRGNEKKTTTAIVQQLKLYLSVLARIHGHAEIHQEKVSKEQRTKRKQQEEKKKVNEMVDRIQILFC